jgi:trimeric autotransporter adhesin
MRRSRSAHAGEPPADTPAGSLEAGSRARLSLAALVLCLVSFLLVTGEAPTVGPPPPVLAGRVADTAGSVPVGSATYPVPGDATFVSPSGSDSNVGTLGSPLRTISRAITSAPDGGTIVLRAGSYHESLSVVGKRLTIQNYPHEAAWLEGSSVVAGWQRTGSSWRRDGWTVRFDHSPTYARGALDNGAAGWTFVSPSHPMAAHPDQVWVDGSAQAQVGSLAEIRHGTFFVDEASQRLYLGSDPTGHVVRVSDLVRAVTVRMGAGTVLRGFGARRFAPSVPDIAGITLESPSITAENLVVTDMATTGVSATASNITLRHVTVERSGMLGIHASQADGLQVIGVRCRHNNVEQFNMAPVSGGFKIGRSRGLLVQDSSFSRNAGPGLWEDESTYDSRLVGNDFRHNAGHGVSLEISARALVADNVFLGNARDGLKVNNTSDVQLWNNTFVDNGRAIDLVQDDRRAADLSEPGHDPRRPLPDPTVTWLLGPVAVYNNVVARPTAATDCFLCVEDYSHERSAQAMAVTSDSNVYDVSHTRGVWIAVWSLGPGDPAVYPTLHGFQSGTGQESHGRAYAASVVGPSGQLSAAVAKEALAAKALPPDIAAAIAEPVNAHHLGAWLGDVAAAG